MAAVANIYTGFSLALSPYSGLMPLVFVGFLILHLVQGLEAATARAEAAEKRLAELDAARSGPAAAR